MAFSFDEYFDPILRQAADEFEPSVPWVFRGAFRTLADRLIAFSVDDAVKSLVERLIAEYLDGDQSQPFVGFALARISKSEAQAVEAAGFDPLTILTLITYAIQVVEWFRKRREASARATGGLMALDASPAPDEPKVVDMLLLFSMACPPERIVEPATTADVSGMDARRG